VYESLGDSMRRSFPGYDAWVITSSPTLAKRIGLRAKARIPLFNGAIECRLLHFPISSEKPIGVPAFRQVHDEARAFENRLRKNLKIIGKRAEREGLDVFRLYDADIPEYNVAVDRYADHVLVQEYAAPWSVDPDIAARRLRDAMTLVAEVLEVPRHRLHLAVRKRQTSGAQYERREDEGTRVVVREGECRFEVRFDERLDTGLFPDHRILRARIAEAAQGKDLLNLFAYTCSASVVAAKAGARSTTSVDLSSTYLEWGERNFALNHLGMRSNELVRADCLQFLEEEGDKYDVVFANPPSYSRSHRMERDFTVIRDHGYMLDRAMRRTRHGGVIFFSTHARGFVLDEAVRARYDVTDLAPRSVPFDFERSPHQAFAVCRRSA
jgi:23S rRNA (guanine2445-N2)-methyltransferase / 23S rRNA (guanine2069-N7)-methyltransferase